MNADLLAMLSGGGLGGMPGAGGANPAEESGTELLRFKAGRMKAELQQVRFLLPWFLLLVSRIWHRLFFFWGCIWKASGSMREKKMDRV